MGQEHRTKIANSKILSELVKFAEGKTKPDEYPPHRVTAALGLLKKVMPDLTENMIKGDEDNPVKTVTRIELVSVKPSDNG